MKKRQGMLEKTYIDCFKMKLNYYIMCAKISKVVYIWRSSSAG